jgi:dihydroflavonol-4-reductase
MKILITGADGLLGSNLCRLLLEQGHELNVLLHPQSKSTSLDELNIVKYEGDILKPETIEPAMQDCDAVIHAAANTSVWPARSAMVRKVNVEGTKNMVNTAIKKGIKRFVYIGSGSSVNASGGASKYRFAGEKFGLDYIDSKYDAMQYVFSKKEEISCIAVLPTFMVGAFDSLPSSGKLIQTLALGKLKFYSGGGRNFVHVNDVANAIANGLTLGGNGNWYIAGGENLSYKEYFDKVASIVNKPAPKMKMPNFLIKIAGNFGSLMGAITKKPPMITKQIATISCEDQFVDSSKTIKELKMPQTPIETAINDCYQWFKENNYV